MLSEKSQRVASQVRKSTKSAMEKKRRARINDSLKELKKILAGIITYKGERFDKMEKADILEMTVQYVHKLQKNANKEKTKSLPNDEEYTSGVNSCLGEVIKYIASNNDCDTKVKTQILDHLANRINGINNQESGNTQVPNSNPHLRSVSGPSPVIVCTATQPVLGDGDPDTNNNSHEAPNRNCTVETAATHQPESQSCVQPVFDGTAQFVPVIQPAPQQSPVVQPLTLVVPASMYTSGVRTTCLVPIAMSTSPSLQQHQLVNIDSSLLCANQNSEIKEAANNGQSVQMNQFVQSQNSIPNHPSMSSQISPLRVQTSPNVSAEVCSTLLAPSTNPQTNIYRLEPQVSVISNVNILQTRSSPTISTVSALQSSQSNAAPSQPMNSTRANSTCKIIKPIPVHDRNCQSFQGTNYTVIGGSNGDHNRVETHIKPSISQGINVKNNGGQDLHRDCTEMQTQAGVPQVPQTCQNIVSPTKHLNDHGIYLENSGRREMNKNIVLQQETVAQTVSQDHGMDRHRDRFESFVEHQQAAQCLWRPF